MERLPNLQPLRSSRNPPKLPRFPIFGEGPRFLGSKQTGTEFTMPPPDFKPGTVDEWMAYLGLWKILKCRGDARQGPFFGGEGDVGDFVYQRALLGPYRRAPGSAVADFEVRLGNERIVIRVVTEAWHIFALNAQQVRDELQRYALAGISRVLDIFSQSYIRDATGQAVCTVLKEALADAPRINPIIGGAFRTRLGRI